MASCKDNIKKELHKTKSGLRMLSNDGSKASPFLIDEPPWISDHEVPMCEKCGQNFDFFNRRHHCRRCGRIFCDKDTRKKLPLPRMSFIDPVRLCAPCADVTAKENEFFDKYIKVLIAGANFNVTSSASDDASAERQYQCKLSAGHRFLEFQSSQYNHDPVELSGVSKVQILASDANTGPSLANGITLKYADMSGNEQTISLRVRNDNSKKAAASWIVAMQKGMKLIFESKSCEND